MTDLETFAATILAIVQGNIEALETDTDDPIGVLEAGALMAAAHAFITYQKIRAMRIEHDAHLAEPAPPAADLN